LIRCIRPRGLLQRLREDLWNTKYFFELRCDLEHELPDVVPAKLPIKMQPVVPRTFSGFNEELANVDADNYLKVLLRTWYCRAGVEALYVAFDGDNPAYAQWLATPEGQRRIPWFLPGRFPPLKSDQLLLEGAYTFVAYRRLGLMGDGMAQLLRIARQTDASAVITYVAADNIPSLRGCANVGFVPHRIRVSTRRLLRRTTNRPVGAQDREVWEAATAKSSDANKPPAESAPPEGGQTGQVPEPSVERQPIA
jgi:hypothetical protein